MNESKKEKDMITFFCKNCDLLFKIEDETLLDDIKCPKCGTFEIFIEYEMEDDEVKL